ncbi:DUF5984 family protein [Micromonospora sp. NPDC049081]|uniref:DUF5984 family protein n=1 Tax=Micromonospora sp. NPDC049081 TaxID=3155150 RepID=UPI00340EB40E
MDWRHEDDGEIGFTADPTVQLGVPTAAYREAVDTLHRELTDTMGQRVEELEHHGGLPHVHLDVALVRRGHERRRHWLTKNLECCPQTDWDTVRRSGC